MINQTKNSQDKKSTVSTLDEAIAALKYFTGEYPKTAVEFVINHRIEATPKLLELLKNTLEHYETLDENHFAHIHAMFILAQFREKKAFNYIIDITGLPDKWSEELLGDVITEDLHNILASVYDGNLQKIKYIIEDQKTSTWSRNAALKSLLVLVKKDLLKRGEIISYLRTLFGHVTFINNHDATTHLVNTASDLYPKELYGEITEAFQKGLVDNLSIDMKWIDDVLTLGKDAALKRYLYDYPLYDFIDDAVNSVQCWACFTKEKYNDDDLLLRNNDAPVTISSHRGIPKVSRNDPCPCGSGKKFKKCCLQ